MDLYYVLYVLKQQKKEKGCYHTCVDATYYFVKNILINVTEEKPKTELVYNAEKSFYTVTLRNTERDFENKKVKEETF